MQYNKTVTLKDGRTCHLRNGTAADGADVLAVFHQTHAETDYLLTYPDENHMTEEQESTYLAEVTASPNAIEICAVVDGKVVGTAGFSPVGGAEKLRHRAEFGIAIRKDSWGLGVGRALTEACIDRARRAMHSWNWMWWPRMRRPLRFIKPAALWSTGATRKASAPAPQAGRRWC